MKAKADSHRLQEMTKDDFAEGILAALRSRGTETIYVAGTRWDTALHACYEELLRQADAYQIDVRFNILPDPIHGDSITAQECRYNLGAWGLVTFDSPRLTTMRIAFSRDRAERLLEKLPGSVKLFQILANTFRDAIENAT